MKKNYMKPLVEEYEAKYEQPIMAGSNGLNGEPSIVEPDEEDLVI